MEPMNESHDDETSTEAAEPGSEAERQQQDAERVAAYQESTARGHGVEVPPPDAAPVEVGSADAVEAPPVNSGVETPQEFSPPVSSESDSSNS